MRIRQIETFVAGTPVWAQVAMGVVLLVIAIGSIYGRLNRKLGAKIFTKIPPDEIRTNWPHIIKYTVIPVCAAAYYIYLFVGVHIPERMRTLERNGVSIDVPKNWIVQDTEDPMVYLVADPQNSMAVLVIREAKEEMRVKDLQECCAVNIEKMTAVWENRRLGEKTSHVINGKNAVSVDGSAILTDPKGVKMPSRLRLVTVEGEASYYLLYLSVRLEEAQRHKALLLRVIESFKAP